MKINLSPQRRDDTLEVSVSGLVLTLNGEEFDFSAMPDGATLPGEAIDSHWFAGEVRKEAGVLEVTLLLPIPADPSDEQAFPKPLLNVGDGPVHLPRGRDDV